MRRLDLQKSVGDRHAISWQDRIFRLTQGATALYLALLAAIYGNTPGVRAGAVATGLPGLFTKATTELQKLYNDAKPLVLALWLAIIVLCIFMIMIADDDRAVTAQKTRIKRTTIALFLYFGVGYIATWIRTITTSITTTNPWTS